MIDLQLPISADQAGALELGAMVTVSGLLFTGRSRFHMRAIDDGIVPPIDFAEINCFLHAGPVMRATAEGWQVVSIEPTSSIRFERYSADVVRKLGLRTLIGKTTMGPATAAALAEVGGVHLTKVGVCGNQLSQQIKRVRDVHFLDELGKTEATWIMEAERLGPFFVDIDAHGHNYFEDLDRRTRTRLDQALREAGVPDDFALTDVSAGSE